MSMFFLYVSTGSGGLMVFVLLCFMLGAPKAKAVLVLFKNLPETEAQAIVSSDRLVELGVKLGTLSKR